MEALKTKKPKKTVAAQSEPLKAKESKKPAQKPVFPDAADLPTEQYKAISSLFGKNPGGSDLTTL